MNASAPAVGLDSPVSAQPHSRNHEHRVRAANGWFSLVTVIVLFLIGLAVVLGTSRPEAATLAGAVGCILAGGLMCAGFFTLQPNEAAVLLLFGAYKGTVRESGFFFTNPFNKRLKISL